MPFDSRTRRLVASVLMGVGLGLATGWFAFGASTIDPGRTQSPEASTAREVTALEHEVADLRRRLRASEESTSSGERTSSANEPEAKTTVEPVLVSQDAIDAFLREELERMLAGDAIRRRFALDRKGLYEFLVTTWLAAGRPEHAFSVVVACARVFKVWKEALATGEALLAAGNRTLATEAFLLVFPHEPYRVMGHLSELAPDRALAMLDDPVLKDDIAFMPRVYGRIRMLNALGRTADLLAYVDDLAAKGDLPRDVWKDVVDAAPADSERRLRALITSCSADDRPWYELRLADAIASQGRIAEATTMVQAELARKFDPLWLDALTKWAPEQALRYLDERARRLPGDALTLNLYAKELARAGRAVEAFATYEKSLALRFEGGIASRLLELDPVRAATVLSPLVQRDDEELGNIGDALWKAGHRALGLDYWQRAARVDPSDREWKHKLDMVQAGGDPFSRR
ncbi:MAG: hypothetical protein KDC95_00495 [Planctomycetes bacterium]|nr:hypothetical protein [Planctomycetota bacterium]